MIKKLFLALVFFLLVAAAGAGAVLYWFVVHEPGDEISEQNIRSILGRESPVFYSDGVSPLGAFFSEARRKKRLRSSEQIFVISVFFRCHENREKH